MPGTLVILIEPPPCRPVLLRSGSQYSNAWSRSYVLDSQDPINSAPGFQYTS